MLVAGGSEGGKPFPEPECVACGHRYVETPDGTLHDTDEDVRGG